MKRQLYEAVTLYCLCNNTSRQRRRLKSMMKTILFCLQSQPTWALTIAMDRKILI